MKLYISGPMSGYPSFNFPAFDALARELREMGQWVFNPADHDRQMYDMEDWAGFATGDLSKCPKFSLIDAFHWDFARIIECEALVMLQGWERSSGAKTERFVAEQLGKYVYLTGAIRLLTPDPIQKRMRAAMEQ